MGVMAAKWKSTFINSILKAYAEAKKDVITVSHTAGTTLDLIKIPIHGAIQSLNVSVAASVLIYDVVRQRLNQ